VYQNKFEAVGDPGSYEVATRSYNRIKKIQREMKKGMPFIGAGSE
jgi:hypothetical protein